jgi:N-acyl amino acid synthase of PEP-CTERM/exosortase system
MLLHNLTSPKQFNKQLKINNLFTDFQKKFNIKKAWTSLQKVRAANVVCSHFTQYFAFEIADTTELKEQAFKIRHQVYCEELKYEPIQANGFEQDQFDSHSSYCLIKHFSSDLYAGTVRIVNSSSERHEILPIEQYCLDTITELQYAPSNFSRDEICEISRLAVPSIFRRRQVDKFPGAATGTFNEKTYSEKELRCFPFIAIGLYFSAASLALKSGKRHAFVMMEPRLARNMRFVGIKFKQIGPVVNYHGRRAPYYINADLLNKNLSSGFKTMLNRIQKTINSL